MLRLHLAAAVLVSAVFFGTAARGEFFFRDSGYGSWETIPAEFEPRYDAGYTAGYPVGYQSGFKDGQVRGRNEGWTNGKSDGHTAGWGEAYPLAFDIAYDEIFPRAHLAGWKDGVLEGFREGYDYAPQIAEEILKNWDGRGGGSYFGSLSVSTLGHLGLIDAFVGDGIIVWKGANDNNWSKLAFDEGFKTGKAEGFSVGSTDGYDDTYGPTYDQAYPIGHQLGIWEGTAAGNREGRKQGRDEGREAGHELGFGAGFYAGIEHRIFGEFVQPKYTYQYARRSDPLARLTLVAMNAPEPTSALLFALGGVLVAGGRRTRSG
ncbi:MAG: hypothetical protein AB7G28_23200 [Pirellulales bacterium]